MATVTQIRGQQIQDTTISGAHIIDEEISEPKLNCYNSPTDGYVLSWNDSQSQFEWSALGSLVVNEVPTGNIDGSNVTYTLANTPETGSEQVYLNGLHQEPGVGKDYTIAGDTITFIVAPITDDILLVTYLQTDGLAGGALTQYATTTVTSGTTGVTTSDFGKTYVMTGAGDCTFNLPSVDVSHKGAWLRFAKDSTTSGTLTLDAADSDIIADSSAGATIYDDQTDENYATITVQLISATQWAITGAHGSWTTT